MKFKRQEPLIYGKQYHTWREGKYLGVATWTNDENIGDSFLIPDKVEKNVVNVCVADDWELIKEKLNHCPDCGKKGYRTTLLPPTSYACKRCHIWWIAPSKNNKLPHYLTKHL